METRKEKVKKIWKDHKKEIIIGSAAFVGGVVITVIAGKRVYGDRIRFANGICTFGVDPNTGRTMMQDMDLAMIGSNYAGVFSHRDNATIPVAAERLVEYYTEKGYDLDKVKVTGLVAFIEK